MIYETTELNPSEIYISKYLGAIRYANNRRENIGGYENTSQMNEIEKEQMAVAGELGFAKLLNVYPPMSQIPSEMKSAPDFIFGSISLDVKTTYADKNHLMVSVASMAHPRDYYVSMIIEYPKIHYRGWATYDDVEKSRVVHPRKGSKPFHAVEPAILNPDFDFLLNLTA